MNLLSRNFRAAIIHIRQRQTNTAIVMDNPFFSNRSRNDGTKNREQTMGQSKET